MKLSFYGAAGGEVTGSNHLLEAGGAKLLIDCGMFQGSEWHDRKNFEPFPYDPKEITAVFVTHAHVDHIGRIPKLIKDGFTGKIYSTAPTKDLAEPLLLDSAHILAGEAERFGTTLLYGEAEVDRALAVWQTVTYDTPFTLPSPRARSTEAHDRSQAEGSQSNGLALPELEVTFYDAGHILGSSFILVEAEGKRIVFSGDLGNTPALLVRPTEHIKKVDYCVLESTYGGRIHEPAGKRVEILLRVIKETVRRRGVLIVPAFAMERTQDLIFELNQLAERHRIPKVPIFVDSPLAIKLTAIYKSYPMLFNDEVRKIIAGGDDIFIFNGLHFTPSSEESKAINNVPAPKVIIASSGMSEGGRIVHHERRYLSDPKNSILFVGYQPPTSLGGRIQSGEKMVRILGEDIHVRAKIHSLGSYSAHADKPRLLSWLGAMKDSLKKVFVIHGDPEERIALIREIHRGFHLKTEAPDMGSAYDII